MSLRKLVSTWWLRDVGLSPGSAMCLLCGLGEMAFPLSAFVGTIVGGGYAPALQGGGADEEREQVCRGNE